MEAEAYDAAVATFLEALGVTDTDSMFAFAFEPHQVTVKYVTYTEQPNGTMSGVFWNDVIGRGNEDD